jgi:hypothetical protein
MINQKNSLLPILLSVLLVTLFNNVSAQEESIVSNNSTTSKKVVTETEALAAANDSTLYSAEDLEQLLTNTSSASNFNQANEIIRQDAALSSGHPDVGKIELLDSLGQKTTFVELVSKRDEFSTTFHDSIADTYCYRKSAEPLHYKDESGFWRNVDVTLTASSVVGVYELNKQELPIIFDSNTGETFVTTNTNVGVTLGKNINSFQRDQDGNVLVENQRNNTFERTIYERTSTLIEFLPGVNLNHEFDFFGVKTSYIINERSFVHESAQTVIFEEELDLPQGWTLDLRNTDLGEGREVVVLNENGEPEGKYTDPFFYDNRITNGTKDSTYQPIIGEYNVVLENGIYKIQLLVPAAWLLDENTQFPVTIDPNFIVDNYNYYGADKRTNYGWCDYNLNATPTGGNVTIYNTRNYWTMNAHSGAWRSEQRSRVESVNGAVGTYSGSGNSAGNNNYDVWSGIGNGTTVTRGYNYRVRQTWLYYSGCSSNIQDLRRRYVDVYYNIPCTVQGNPAVFGSNTWNVYAYSNNNYGGYSGYYTEGTLNFNTQSRWGSGGAPSQASGYLGCSVGNDNHSFIHKRQGFPAGNYTIDMIYDDQVILLINGTQVYANTGCCALRNGVWSGYLDGSSTVEMRVREFGGGSNARIIFNTWLSAPSVGNGSVTTCSGTIYDYEGPAADYGNGANGFMVINPSTVGGRVILSGTKNTEGNYDYLSIWNGVGLVGNIYNSSGTANVPQFTSSDASGALTVRFTSDGSVTRPGFALPISCCTPDGDQVSYGTNQWLGYVYDNDNFTRYNGYVTQSNDFDQGFGGDNVNYPTNGCPTQTESFSVRYKNRRNFACGIYRFRLRGDDGHRISIDGGATWLGQWWYGQGWGTNHYTGYVYLNGNVDLVLEYYEGGGGNRMTLNTESITPTVSASINQGASGLLCAGSTLSLTATGSSNYGPISYAWTGPGSYSASGTSMSRTNATAGTYTLTVTHACGQTGTDTYVLTTHTAPTAPTGISGTITICGGTSTTLTATGGTSGSGATYQWYAGGCGSGGVLGTGVSLNVTPGTTTTYYVRRVASGANACTNTTGCASQTVTVNTQPVANAGIDQTQCNNNAFTISGASITGSGTFNNWTYVVNSGTATITNTGSLNGPTITPTSGAGQVTMTLNVNGTSPCANVTDVMVMSWSASPAVSAGPDMGQCGAANLFFTGSSASAGSTVSWTLLTGQPGETGGGAIITGTGTNPTTWGFNPSSASGVKYVRLSATASVACGGGTITDDLIITWDETPSVSVTSPQNSCTGTTGFNITGASASGTGTLSWGLVATSGTASITTGGTTITPTFTPTTTSGQYTLTLTSTGTGECAGSNPSSVMTVNWEDPPTSSAGTDFSVCEGTAQAMTGSSIGGGSFSNITWTQTGGTATGSFTATHPTDPTLWVYTPTSAGTAILQLAVTGSGAICGSTIDTDSRTITWDPLPVLDASTDLNVCYSSGAIAMSGASASNYSSYTWSGGDPAFGSWNQAGTVPTANFTPIAIGGSFLATLSVNGNGACSATSFTDTRTVNWFESPSAIAGTASTTCGTAGHGMGGSSASGTFSAVSWSGNPNGSWTTTNLTDPAQWVWTPTTASGSFTSTLTVTGGGACLGTNPTATRLISWDAAPSVNAGLDIVACSGTGAISMTGASVTNIGSYSWSNFDPLLGTWNQGASAPVATFTPANPSGQILATLSVTGTGACSAINFSDDRLIDWTAAPVISAVSATDVTDCSNDNGTIVITATGDDPLAYSIDNGSTYQASAVFDNLNDGVNYNIIVQDVNNCTTSYASNPLVLNGPTTPVLTIATSDATCNGSENGAINVTVASGGTARYAIDVTSSVKTYLDTTAAIGQTANFTVFGGSYTVTVADRFGCTTVAGPYVISEPPAISVSTIVVNNTNCTGNDGSITIAASGGTPGFTYSFNGSGFTGTTVYGSLTTGSYPIIVRDANNCDVSFEESIGGPFEANAGNDRYLCSGSALQMNGQLDVNIDWGSQARSYTSTVIGYNARNPSWSVIGLGDDQLSGAVGIPFTFNYYGNSYTNLFISSNGYVTFTNDGNNGCCAGQTLPTATAPNNLIALCWEDLDPPEGGVVRYGTFGASPNRVFVIEYNNIQHYPNGNPVTGQIHLFESTNNIEIHHSSVPTDGDGSIETFGIENSNGTSGIGYSGTNWVSTNTGYLFQPDPNVGTINYTWSPSTGLSSISIPNPTVSGLTSDQTYTLQVEIVGLCTLTDDMTVYVSDMASESSGTYGTAPNVSNLSDVVCNGDDDGCITVTPTTGEAPYLLEGPAGEVQVYDGRMKELTVSNTTGTTLTDYQVDMTVSYEGTMRADFGDLRFFDGSTGNVGDVLPYYVETYTLSTSARIYVKVPSIPNGGTTVYMAYGNAALTSQSDPDNTLLLYEDMMESPSGTHYGNASYIDHQFTRLTQASGGVNGQLDYNLNPSTGGNGYVADFEFWIGGGNGADALYQYSDCASRPLNEDAATGGYTFAYDTYQDQHQTKWNGTTTATNAESGFDNATWRTAKVEQYNTTGRMYLDGVLRLTGVVTADNVGNAFGFGARTGGLNNEHRVRNIRVRKLVSPNPGVTFGTEQLPDNQFCDLTPGTYSISVWDVAECTINEISIPIVEPTLLTIDGITVTDTWCYTTNNGELDLTVTGGTQISPAPPYLYTWAGPSGYSSSLEDITGLNPGVYNITVVDDNACSGSSSATVNSATPITAPNFTWTGMTDQLWQDPTNWDCGLPDAASEVILPDTPIGGNTVIIQNGIVGNVLNIDVQGTTPGLLEIQNGGLLRIFEP